MNKEYSASPAWLIHYYPVRDNLLLTYVLTPSQLIKGFYRVPKHKNLRILPQAFLPYHVIYRRKNDMINIQSLEPIGPGYTLKHLQLWLGMYLNELVFHLLRHEHSEDNYQFFKCYESIIAHLEPCPEALIREFEYYLLQDCGFGLDFLYTSDGQAIEASNYYQFKAGNGFLQADEGYAGKDILAVAEGQFDNKALKPILRQTIDMVLEGKVLNSRELLRQWLKKQGS